MDIDRWQFIGRDLDDLYVVIGLHEFAPVGWRAASGRGGWRFERLAKMREILTDWPWIGGEGDEPDVAAAVQARKGELLTNPGHKFCPEI